jgi:heme A synthase
VSRTQDLTRPSALIRVLGVATATSTYLLLVLGSTVRVTDSGMGCRGWPLCSGQTGPIDHFHPLMEQSHRFLATLVTVLLVALLIAVYRAGEVARHVRGPAVTSAAMIVVQIVLGAVTVFTSNAPWTVGAHLLVATLFMAAVTVGAVATFVDAGEEWPRWRLAGPLAWWALGALFLIVTSGSVVVNAGAQAACRSWPLCSASPSAWRLIVVQMTHRSLVLAGSLLVVWYLVHHLRAEDRAVRTLALVDLALLALQVVAGAISALDGGRAGAADVHLALATALWTVLVALVAVASRRPRPVADDPRVEVRPGP